LIVRRRRRRRRRWRRRWRRETIATMAMMTAAAEPARRTQVQSGPFGTLPTVRM